MSNVESKNSGWNEDGNADASQIIMVNSFKGGCGKTSISLSLCVTESIEYYIENAKLPKEKKRNRKILYLDIDILGTAVEYSIYENGKKKSGKYPTYMDVKYGIEKGANDVKFAATSFESAKKIRCTFSAMLLNPVARQTTSYASNITARKNSNSLDKVFLDKLVTFLTDYVKKTKDFFIVLDCSPGFNDFEKTLIEEIHKIKKVENANTFEFIECFVTTLDEPHIEKTISSIEKVIFCKNNLTATSDKCDDGRIIKIILNDLTDLRNWSKKMENRKSIDADSYLENLCAYLENRIVKLGREKTEEQAIQKSIFVMGNGYEEGISESNLMFLNESDIRIVKEIKNSMCLENNPDAYTNNKLRKEVIKREKDIK